MHICMTFIWCKLYIYWTNKLKSLKVAKLKDANYGCKDEGDDDVKVYDNGGFLGGMMD